MFINPLLHFIFQADEPIADYAAMDDVMQGEAGGDPGRFWGSGKAPHHCDFGSCVGGQGLCWVWVVKVENRDVESFLSLSMGDPVVRHHSNKRSL